VAGNVLWCNEKEGLPGIDLSFILVHTRGGRLAQQSWERDVISPSLLRLHEYLHHAKPGGIVHRSDCPIPPLLSPLELHSSSHQVLFMQIQG